MITTRKLKDILYHATILMSRITSISGLDAAFTCLVKKRHQFRQQRHKSSSAAIASAATAVLALILLATSAVAAEINFDKCKDKYYQEYAKAKAINKKCLRKSKNITLAKNCNHAYNYRLAIENNNKYNCMTTRRGTEMSIQHPPHSDDRI